MDQFASIMINFKYTFLAKKTFPQKIKCIRTANSMFWTINQHRPRQRSAVLISSEAAIHPPDEMKCFRLWNFTPKSKVSRCVPNWNCSDFYFPFRRRLIGSHSLRGVCVRSGKKQTPLQRQRKRCLKSIDLIDGMHREIINTFREYIQNHRRRRRRRCASHLYSQSKCLFHAYRSSPNSSGMENTADETDDNRPGCVELRALRARARVYVFDESPYSVNASHPTGKPYSQFQLLDQFNDGVVRERTFYKLIYPPSDYFHRANSVVCWIFVVRDTAKQAGIEKGKHETRETNDR